MIAKLVLLMAALLRTDDLAARTIAHVVVRRVILRARVVILEHRHVLHVHHARLVRRMELLWLEAAHAR